MNGIGALSPENREQPKQRQRDRCSLHQNYTSSYDRQPRRGFCLR
jgi:hypothetical protein